jgi:tetratricopeptide (TPR) repeat protein
MDHRDPAIQTRAVETLARRRAPGIAERLLAPLDTAVSHEFAFAALKALADLGGMANVRLADDLLDLTTDDFSDVHPRWGASHRRPGWAESLHAMLGGAGDDAGVRRKLDYGLAGADPTRRRAAVAEITRWLEEEGFDASRAAEWRDGARIDALLGMALGDGDAEVRSASRSALKPLRSDTVVYRLAQALDAQGATEQLAAAEALVALEAQPLFGRVAQRLLELAQSGIEPGLRRRAGEALRQIPDGLAPLYQPIQEAIGRDDARAALTPIASALECVPADANLLWWQGHALRDIGRLDEAVSSFEQALVAAPQAPEIPQTLARTYWQLGDPARAGVAAQRGVEIAPLDAHAHAVLAWSSFKAGSFEPAAAAAVRAVDLDPVHGDAIWIAVLAQIRCGAETAARSAYDHALRVWRHLSPGLDDSFLTQFRDEIAATHCTRAGLQQLLQQIRADAVWA